MKSLAVLVSAFSLAAFTTAALPAQTAPATHPKRNIIIFVADGLRHDSVNPIDAPTLLAARVFGTHFTNSHSLFPTFTTPNASAIATGHLLGDTGDFSNTIYGGYPVFESGNFGQLPGTVTPFVESDPVLADLNARYNGDWLNEESLMALARANGYNTASIGKVGPVAIQDVSQLRASGAGFAPTQTIFVDDATGSAAGIPLSAAVQAAYGRAGLPTVAPTRSNGAAATSQGNNGYSGNNQAPGTLAANITQQNYFANTVTEVLPQLLGGDKPFVLMFWSRDPDGTQHNQGDSLNKLTPGINGPTSKAAVKNADNDLYQIASFVAAFPQVAANTDLFVTSDHGFATISKHEVDAAGTATKAYASTFTYKDATGRQEVNAGFLPPGFLAIDLAHALNLPLFDPDSQITVGSGKVYEPVDPTVAQQTATVRQRPAAGDGLIGGTGAIQDKTDARVVVAANGGSDLVYVPAGDYQTVRRVADFLTAQDYAGSVFVDDQYGPIPGTLPLSSIGLLGTAQTPRPSIAISFKTFYLQPGNLLSAVQIADSGLQEGQGMHGSIARDNTFNNMAAYGPDFKMGFTDDAPVSNADIARTFAYLMGTPLEDNGGQVGRVLTEALAGGPATVGSTSATKVSAATQAGMVNVLHTQSVGTEKYFDSACMVAAGSADQTCN